MDLMTHFHILYGIVGFMVCIWTIIKARKMPPRFWPFDILLGIIFGIIWLPQMIFLYFIDVAER